MLHRHGVCRPSQKEINELEHFRAIILEATEFLKRFPVPDTFLGRKTQEPFAKEAKINKIIVAD